MIFLSAVLALVCASCTDRDPHLPETTASMEATPVLRCTVDVGSAALTCAEENPLAHGASHALLGNASVKLRSANNAYDSLTLMYGFDVTVQNLLKYSIGTADGQTRAGLKVFFERIPYVTAYKNAGDTGTVVLLNPDGAQNFTAASQPYFLYDTILQPQAITNAKRWQFRLPSTVQSFGFSVRVFTATPREGRVPTSAPTGKPSWFYDPAYSIDCGTLLTGTCLRNVVLVEFRATATQEERQAAVDLVGGFVVGGQTGAYFVQIPTPDSSYIRHVANAVQQLASLPQVEYVSGYLTTRPSPDFARPRDDANGWRRWQLNPDSADGENWAFERVGGPYAWGCSTGDTSTIVGIVDSGFHTITDLTKNSALMEAPNAFPQTQDHGTSVAAIVAGYGNDSVGVTGMMWRARLRMYDWTLNGTGDWQDLWDNVRDARVDGARVINISVGFPWTAMNPDTATNPTVIQANLATVRNLYRGFRRAMDTLPNASQPLIVFSAGNSNMDARWNAARIAADSAPANGWAVLVVGGSNRTDGYYSRTNTGTLVRVSAPAEDVSVIGGNGVIGSGQGTSYAAPMASGLAGLLASFDPRLTALEIRDLIIQGAERGGRRVAGNGPPIINARESLILAGRRGGAPLCGNRMWVANGNFYAQRDSASSTGEALFPAPVTSRTGTVAFNAMHGGKEVMFYTRPTRTGRQWTENGWTTIPFSDTGPNNGAFLSRAGQSHDQDSTLVLERELTNNPNQVIWRPVVRTAAGEVRLPNVITDSLYDGPAVCLSRFVDISPEAHAAYMEADPQIRDAYLDWRARIGFPGNCTLVGPSGGRTDILNFLAYAPVGQQGYVFIVARETTVSPTSSRQCARSSALYTSGGTYLTTVGYTAECIDAAKVTTSAGTAAYRINVATGAITSLGWTEPALEIWSPMIREDGREILVERQFYRATASYQWIDAYDLAQLSAPVTASTECVLQFRDLQTGSVVLSPGTCVGSSGGQGGFSAVRSPGSRSEDLPF